MKYDAITIDTNIFDQNRLKSHEGLLKRLGQFKDTLTQFVLSEVIAGEITRHLTRQAQQAEGRIGISYPQGGRQRIAVRAALLGSLRKGCRPPTRLRLHRCGSIAFLK